MPNPPGREITERSSMRLPTDRTTELFNVMTVDVEDYFHVSGFEDVVRCEDWGNFPSRVEGNVRRLLGILAEHSVHATFFVLGWVADRFPNLVKEIHAAGHEIACHSYWHRLIYAQTPAEFRQDTGQAKALLEDITGEPIYGYRAPSYSIVRQTLWAFEVLADLGFIYDSSVYPILRDRYGIPGAPRFPYRILLGNGQPMLRSPESVRDTGGFSSRTAFPSATTPEPNGSPDATESIDSGISRNGLFLEIPPSTIRILGVTIPVAGGGYLRLFPERFTQWAIQRVNVQEQMPVVSVIHPWELDPDQPRLRGGRLSTFRHYVNLRETERRFRSLLEKYRFHPMRDLIPTVATQL